MRASLLALSLLAGTAVAEPVETALLPDPSGPARLVLAHWPASGWMVEKGERAARVRLPGVKLAIDLAAVPAEAFDGRLTSVSSRVAGDATELDFTFGCDCSLALAGDGESRLAIDIVGRELPAGPLLRARSIAPVAAPLPPPKQTARTEPDPAPAEQAAVTSDPELSEARDRLILQLQRAAEAGMIELAEPLPAVESAVAQAAAEAPPPSEGPPDRPALVPETAEGEPSRPTPNPHPERGPADPADPPAPEPLMAKAAPEPDPMPRPIAVPAEAPICHSAADLALAPTEPGPAFVTRVAELRRELIGEFDTPNRDAVEALVRHYIAHGFGAEAHALLETLLPDSPRTPVLATLALALEGAPLPDAHALSAPDCSGEQAVWQALSHAEAGAAGAALEAADRMADALAQMAEPLRSRIAVTVALAAVAEEAWTTARNLRRIAQRGDRIGARAAAGRLLLEARLAERDGDLEAAVEHLRRLWAQEGPLAVEGMIRLAGLIVEKGVADPGDTHLLRLDLGAAGFAHRGTELGAGAVIAEAELRAAAFGRADALDLLALARSDGTLSAPVHDRAVRELALAHEADPEETPLALLVERSPERFAGARREPGFRAALARSFMELGLPARAEQALESGDLADAPLATELAEAYLAADRPGDAERLALLLPDTPRRAVIRAEALAARGAAAEALAVLDTADAGDTALRAQLAWDAEDWAAAAAALEAQNTADPDPATAARLELAARRADLDGSTAPDAGDPREARREPTDPAPGFDPTPAGVASLLEDLRAETAAIREMLDDG